MSEVKVRITAQNETQTGFQAVLNDAKKTAAQVQQTMSASAAPAPSQRAQAQPFQIGDVLAENSRKSYDAQRGALEEMLGQLRSARQLAAQPVDMSVASERTIATSSKASQSIRALASDLLNANSAGDVFSAIINRLTTALGGLVAGAAGFALGRIIAGQIDQATASMENLNSASASLNQSLNSLNAPNLTFEQLGSAVASVTSNINALKTANEEMQGSFRNKVLDTAFKALGAIGQSPLASAGGPLGSAAGIAGAGLGALGLGGGFLDAANQEEEAGVAAARASIAVRLKQLTQDEIALSKTRTDEERKLLQLQQERAQLRQVVGAAGGQKAVDELNKLFAAQDAAQKQGEKTGTRLGNVLGKQLGPGDAQGIEQFRREQEAARRALGPEFGPGTAEAATGGFRVDQAMFQQQQAEEAARLLMQQQQQAFQGSQGASAFQRIGFASNEFFDTRKAKDPAAETAKAVSVLKKIQEILSKGEPLVLANTNS
jgi:hypothetical protein